MRFVNKFADRVYKYLYRHDGEYILQTEMAKEIQISRPTVRKYIKWLERRGLIKKNGKLIKICQEREF